MRTCDKRAKGTLDGTSIGRNMFEHRLNARGPGAVKQRARRASEGTQKTKKLTVFFGCAQRRRYTPQRVRVNMKQCHTNTQTRNARGPGAVSNARGKQAKAPKNKETSSGAAKRSAERPKRHACALLRNIPKHKLSTRGPGAVSDARTEQTKALQKQRNFFGRSKTLSRAPKTPHARAFAKQIKTQTERQRPRRILAAHAASQRRHPTNKETCSGAAKRSAERPIRRARSSIEACSNSNKSHAQQRAGRNRCSSASEHSVSRPSSR